MESNKIALADVAQEEIKAARDDMMQAQDRVAKELNISAEMLRAMHADLEG
jgi:DNA-binding transcriptional regulator YiaG